MMMKKLLATVIAATSVTTASAQDMGDISVGVGVTSFGYSLHGEYELSPTLSARAMIMGGFSIEDTFDAEDSTVDGKADLGGFAVVADYYPLANPWRVSAGLFVSNSEVTGTFDDGVEIYEGKITFKNEVSPLITTGFNYPFGNGWAVSGDLGVIVSSLEASTDDIDGQADVDEINAEFDDIPVFPFIGFAVSYSY